MAEPERAVYCPQGALREHCRYPHCPNCLTCLDCPMCEASRAQLAASEARAARLGKALAWALDALGGDHPDFTGLWADWEEARAALHDADAPAAP